MTRRAPFLTAVFAVALMAVPALHAADAPAANAPAAGNPPARPGDRGAQGPGGDRGPRRGPMNPYANQFQQMERALDLTEDQKPKIKDELDALNQEIDDFRTSAMQKMRDAMTAAQGADDRQKARQDMQDLRTKLDADYQKIVSAHQDKINALLTPDQRATWESFKLARALQQRFGPVDLTEDQKKQIEQLARDAGKDLAAAKDAAATDAITGKLVKKILAEILTDAQAGKLIATAAPGIGAIRVGAPEGPGGPPRQRPQGAGGDAAPAGNRQ